MEHTLINHPKLRVSIRSGSEGPRHDPYSYTETIVKQPEGTTILHEGLGTWLMASGRKVSAPPGLTLEQKEDWCRATAFVTLTGYTLNQLFRIERKRKSRCRQCGSRKVEEVAGYPGETFEQCAKCGNVLDAFFCLGDIE